jgi:hypothetical protein
MRREHGTEVFLAAQGLDDTGREDLGCELGDLEAGVGAEWGWLPDEGVTDQEGGKQLADAEEEREVPRDDGDADAERDPAYNSRSLPREVSFARKVKMHQANGRSSTYILIVDGRLFRQSERRHRSDVVVDKTELIRTSLWWLPRFAPKQIDELLLVGHDGVGELHEVRSSLVLGQLAPGRESSLGSAHGTVDIVLRGNGHVPQRLLGAGADGIARLGRLGQLVVDYVVIGLEIR